MGFSKAETSGVKERSQSAYWWLIVKGWSTPQNKYFVHLSHCIYDLSILNHLFTYKPYQKLKTQYNI